MPRRELFIVDEADNKSSVSFQPGEADQRIDLLSFYCLSTTDKTDTMWCDVNTYLHFFVLYCPNENSGLFPMLRQEGGELVEEIPRRGYLAQRSLLYRNHPVSL